METSSGLFHPSKIVAVGLNYFDHAKELNMPVPDHPILFLKPPTGLLGDGQPIVHPAQSREVHYEAELAVVIKDRVRNISAAEAPAHILGYTCANDVTARDLQKIDGQWTRAKSFDTFCPLGPRIATDVDPRNLNIVSRLNGVTRQASNTREMIFDVFRLVEFISGIMTLLPGDVILTGTPPGVGPMKIGDTIEIEIDHIGVLRNKIAGAEENRQSGG